MSRGDQAGAGATERRRLAGIPVRELRVEVIGGPDRGAHAIAKTTPISIGTATGNTLSVSDPTVSRYHVELSRAEDRVRVVDLGSTNGTVIGSACLVQSDATVAPGATIQLGATHVAINNGGVVMVDKPPQEGAGGIRSRAASMQPLLSRLPSIASNDAPVLLLGESGTGKELFARTIHELSPRATQPFVVLDCAAITPSLFTSTVFGHERGAFHRRRSSVSRGVRARERGHRVHGRDRRAPAGAASGAPGRPRAEGRAACRRRRSGSCRRPRCLRDAPRSTQGGQ